MAQPEDFHSSRAAASVLPQLVNAGLQAIQPSQDGFPVEVFVEPRQHGVDMGLRVIDALLGVVGYRLRQLVQLVGELAYFIDNFPLYIKRVQGLATDSNRPWLSKIGKAF